jgi:hypothetical protein
MGLAAVSGSTALTSRLAIDTTSTNSAVPVNTTTAAGSTTGWSGGTSYFKLFSTFTRLSTPDGPYGDAASSILKFAAKPLDSDGVTIPPRNLSPTVTEKLDCVNLDVTTGFEDAVCNPGSTEANLRRKLFEATLRFGRLRLVSGQGSELAAFKMQTEVQYWDGTYWRTNTADSLTSFSAGSIAIVGTTGTSVSSVAGVSQGYGSITLTKPSSAGTATICMDMATTANGCTGSIAANLGYLLGGSTYDKDPSATVLFGGGNSNSRGNWGFIYRRENF